MKLILPATSDTYPRKPTLTRKNLAKSSGGHLKRSDSRGSSGRPNGEQSVAVMPTLMGMETAHTPQLQNAASSVEDGVYCPTPEQIQAAEERLLEKCGFSREELEEQARQGKFKTESAKRAWFCLP